jgi:DNA-binding MarR family transcriptional regulator
MSDTNRALWDKLSSLRRRLLAGMRGGGLSTLAALELTVPQSMVLFSLVEGGSLSIADLTKVSGRSQGTTSHLVAKLEQRGLVARKEDELDGRRTRVHATAKARRLVAEVEGLRLQSFDVVLASVPHALVKDLDHALAAVLAAMEPEEKR